MINSDFLKDFGNYEDRKVKRTEVEDNATGEGRGIPRTLDPIVGQSGLED